MVDTRNTENEAQQRRGREMKGPFMCMERACNTFYMYSVKKHENGRKNYRKTHFVQST
jgi:hypothetical protein